MSNTLAIAAMTAVLEARIQGLIAANLVGFDTFVDHPKGDDPPAGVYIKPYRIVPNASLRNLDLPTRRSDGLPYARPRLAIDVELMLSFVGEADSYDAERLAGLVMTDLHARPVITTQEIGDFMSSLGGGHVLAGADLGDSLERVRLTPISLSLEDLGRLWGMTGQSHYPLTVAYHATVLLLDADVEPVESLPVTHAPQIFVTPTASPRVSEVRSAARRQPLVATGEELVLLGSNLRGAVTQVHVGDEVLDVADGDARPARVSVTIPATVPAGVVSVRVVHRIDVGGPGDPLRNAGESNAMPVAVVPTVTVANPAATPVVGGVQVRLTVVPMPDPAQQVTLLLDSLGGTDHLSSTSWAVDGANVVFTVAAGPAGAYLVRLRVDGASSLPGTDLQTPAVTLP